MSTQITSSELVAVRRFLSSIGRLGGRSKSRAKVGAVRANLDKARAKRWSNRERGG